MVKAVEQIVGRLTAHTLDVFLGMGMGPKLSAHSTRPLTAVVEPYARVFSIHGICVHHAKPKSRRSVIPEPKDRMTGRQPVADDPVPSTFASWSRQVRPAPELLRGSMTLRAPAVGQLSSPRSSRHPQRGNHPSAAAQLPGSVARADDPLPHRAVHRRSAGRSHPAIAGMRWTSLRPAGQSGHGTRRDGPGDPISPSPRHRITR